MTEEEAKTVARIMMMADGECPHCASELLHDFIRAFPDVKPIAEEVIRECGYSFELDE